MGLNETQRRLEHIMVELHDIINNGRGREDTIIISCKEAARLLDVSQKTISMILRDGRLKKITIGGSTGISLSDIQDIKTQ